MKEVFNVKTSPQEVMAIIDKRVGFEVVERERYDLGNNKFILITICTKYYVRIRGCVTLVIICDNISGNTQLKITSTGVEKDDDFDLGARKHYIKVIKMAIEEYL